MLSLLTILKMLKKWRILYLKKLRNKIILSNWLKKHLKEFKKLFNLF